MEIQAVTPGDDRYADSIDERIFVNENLSHPENRINVALFGLMAQDWFRTWLLRSLDMPEDAIVFPPTNVGTQRPDFTIEDPNAGEPLGWIEVEVGSDAGQLRSYKESFEGCIKAIWGRSGDLSLERISTRLKSELDAGTLAPQPRLSVRLVRKLIEQALGEASSASKPVPVSDKMKQHWLVQALTKGLAGRLDFDLKPVEQALGEASSASKPVPVSDKMKQHWLVQALTKGLAGRLDFDLKPAVPGCLKANARADRGFSIRVYSPKASAREVSVLHVRGAAEDVRFASRARLERYLPDHRAEAIAAWCRVVRCIGNCGEIDTGSETHIPIRIDRGAFDEHEAAFVGCLATLSRAA